MTIKLTVAVLLSVGLTLAGCEDDPAPGADLGPDQGIDSTPTPDQQVDGQADDLDHDLTPDQTHDALTPDTTTLPDQQVVADAPKYYNGTINDFCPPAAIKHSTPYKLKVRYKTMCLGAAPSSQCTVTVKAGNVIELALTLEAHKIGCDATDIGVFDVTCDLPALAAGSYTLVDKHCAGKQPTLTVGSATSGQPTCVSTGC
jgi:hypothetical protein